MALGGPTDEYETWTDAHEPDPEIHPSAPDDCFVQLYTSGTTGFPKGAMLTHRGTLAHSRDLGLEALMDDDGRVQVAMPLFHVGGTSFALFAMANGAHAMVLRAPEPTAVLDMLERERITHTFLVPALLAAASQMPGAAERDFSALRMLVYGASPMPLPVMRACLSLFPGVMRQAYGMTEVGGVASMLGPADHEDPAVARRLVSAGRPIAGVEIEIRDPDTGVLVPTGASGEIWVRIDQLMDGYWSNPKATAEVVTPDGWLRSGDGGHLDADGYVYVTDRIKDMIVSGGENVYPAEIERILVEHPAVVDVAVIGVPDERRGEVPKALVVAAGGSRSTPRHPRPRSRIRTGHRNAGDGGDAAARLGCRARRGQGADRVGPREQRCGRRPLPRGGRGLPRRRPTARGGPVRHIGATPPRGRQVNWADPITTPGRRLRRRRVHPAARLSR